MPIDPLQWPQYALEGKVVTMDDAFRVLEQGVIYIDAGQIVAVQPTGTSAPPGFADVPLIRTGGTIFPGLIELHNHLSYNALPMWEVPRLYSNRSQWGRHPDYRKLISGPMGVIGRTPGYPEALVRYVECKCLLSGVTTSQGIALYSNTGIHRFYRGAVRNVEATRDPELPNASTRIADVEAQNAARFLERLQTSSCLLLHLSEGLDALTIRPLVRVRPPDEDWVTLRYRTTDGDTAEITQPWLLFSPQPGLGSVDPDARAQEAAILGFDLQTDAIHQVKKILLAPLAVAAEQHIAAAMPLRPSCRGLICKRGRSPSPKRLKPEPPTRAAFT